MTNSPIQREAKIAIKVLGKGILINDRNQGDLVFPAWEQSIPTVGIKFSQRGNDVFPAWEQTGRCRFHLF